MSVRRALVSEPFRRIATTTGSAILGLAGGLVSGILTARILAPDGRGVLAIVITTVSLGALVAGLGSNVSLRVYLPRDPRVTLGVFGRTSLWLSAIQTIVLVGAVFVLSALGGMEMSPIDMLITIGPFGLAAFGVSQVLDALNAVGKTNLSALTNAVGTWTTAVALLLGLILGQGLTFALLAYTLGFVARFVFGLVQLRRDASIHVIASGAGGTTLLLRQGVKLLGLNLGQAITFRLDQYALVAFSTTTALGQYAVAVTPASMIQVLSNSVGQVAMRDAATDSLTRNRLLSYLAVTVGGTAVFGAGMALVAPWVMPFVFGPDYLPAAQVVQILVIAEVALSPYLLLSKVAAGIGQLWLSSASGLVGLLTMVLLLPLLVTSFGALGAAWGCVGAYSVMSIFVSSGLLIARRSMQRSDRQGLRVETP